MLLVACLSFLTSGVAVGDESVSRNLQNLLEEVLIEALVYPTAIIQDDQLLLTNVFDSVLPSQDVDFELYTKSNPEEAFYLQTGNSENLKDSPFSSKRSTKVIVHGWIDNTDVYWMKRMRENYLSTGDYNVICVNWFPGSFKEYLVSARLTRQVGQLVGELLEFLATEGNLSYDNVHVLGHSLGAHVAGFTGKYLWGKLGRITGMDPARPAFETPRFKASGERLDVADAKFVDVIHTCSGTVGFVRPIGHVDFYPNGGTFKQPGCPVLSAQYCSHQRSHRYMTESILDPQAFVAVRCQSWTSFKSGKCNVNATITRMGESVNLEARGTYYLETNSRSPFGKSR